MAGPVIRAVGADRFAGTLRTAADKLADLDPGPAAGEILRAEVAREAPRRTGTLAASHRVEGSAVVTDLIYAGVIVGGWPGHGIEANPYTERAAEAAEAAVVEEWDKAAGAVLDLVVGA